MIMIPPEVKSQHLFVLVGGNPLPNYVAIRLLRRDGAHVYLVHTPQTTLIADRICQVAGLVLGKDATKILVKDGDARGMRQAVSRFAKGKPALGLNYTGGTKHMALHVFQGMVVANPHVTLSYLDADALSLRIEQGEENTQDWPVSLALQLTFQDLLALHGHKVQSIEKELICPEVYRSLPDAPYEQWGEWWGRASRGMSGKTGDILLPTEAAFDPIRPYFGAATTVGELANQWGASVSDLSKWFGEAGLESYVLWSMREVAAEAQLVETAKNVMPQGIKFEFDVVAMRGYQLFAVSCANNRDKGKAKLKLMEAYVRSRQMGGDEARVAVVCRIPPHDAESNPKLIEREMAEQLGVEGKIRIFGAEHLPALPKHLLAWFTTR